MIFDAMAQMTAYSGLQKGITDILKEIQTMTPETFETTPIQLDGSSVCVNRSAYETRAKSEASLEAHRKFIDVMAVLEGEETVYVYPTCQFKTITQEYDGTKDVLFAEFDEDAIPVRLVPGMVLILFPGDGHAPSCDSNGKHTVKKIVGKVAVR